MDDFEFFELDNALKQRILSWLVGLSPQGWEAIQLKAVHREGGELELNVSSMDSQSEHVEPNEELVDGVREFHDLYSKGRDPWVVAIFSCEKIQNESWQVFVEFEY